ncbi:Crp/Fnr family transcriptional regulator [Maricaulis salignorans]|uniref:Crp/Fnr family transcriptional regulator n=1 Tax=Maricaulis salignorans TaxID=144026 RepID=UPI003A8DE44F
MADLLDFGMTALGDLLTPRLAERLRAGGTPVRYPDRALIHARGDIKPGLSMVRSGSVRFGNPGSDGSYIVITVMGPGQCFGEFSLFADLPRTHDAVAIGDTVVDQISRTAFDAILAEEPELSRIMLTAVTGRLHAAIEMIDDMRRLPLPVRTAKLIRQLAAASGRRDHARCTQSELAFALGVSRVSSGKALGRLRALGLVEPGYGEVVITDPARLSDWIRTHAELEPLSPAPAPGRAPLSRPD